MSFTSNTFSHQDSKCQVCKQVCKNNNNNKASELWMLPSMYACTCVCVCTCVCAHFTCVSAVCLFIPGSSRSSSPDLNSKYTVL